jgi:hypothetical protein
MQIFQYTWWLWPVLTGAVLTIQSKFGTRVFGHWIVLIVLLLFLCSLIVGVIGLLELSETEKGLKKELHLLKAFFCFGPTVLIIVGFAAGAVG